MASRNLQVPNRWLYCPRKSNSIIAERFLAFKTPLSKEYKDQMPLDCNFTPEMIFGYIKELKLKLGLWIDLTNTKRFYDRSIIDAHGAKYIKLQCRGHGETPSHDQTAAFIQIVDDFINDRPLDIIAVHCTHGFNRTGFLIVSYMVTRLDCSVDAALLTFAKARPPGIYKQDYIIELFRRYETEEDATQAPELPAWCLEYDDSNASGSMSGQKRSFNEAITSSSMADSGEYDDEDENESGSSCNTNGNKTRKRRRRDLLIKNATFMEGVSGVTLVTDEDKLNELQRRVQQMCGWSKNFFPGAQPVSMDRKNIRRLHEIPYMVSWKADGTRYMMLIHKKGEIYFFDRNNSCFQVEKLSFVKAQNLQEHIEDTLLDGEMVLDKFQGTTVPRYLIYDIIKFCNQSIGQQPFYPNRLACIKNEIIKPRYAAIQKGIINRPEEPFGVRNKDFWDIRKSESLLGEKFAKTLLHEPDGLIFQPSEAPYMPGPCPDVLKWKPSDMNSVDFRLKIGCEQGIGINPKKVGFLYVGGFDGPMFQIKLTKELRELDNKIIECTFTQNKWEFMRERTDKVMPNSYDTTIAVCESIRNPVTKEILLDFIEKSGYRDNRDLMPPPNHGHARIISNQNNSNRHPPLQNQLPEVQHKQIHHQTDDKN